MNVLVLLRCRVDQTGVSRRVLRFEILDRLEIARVRDNDRKLLQLLELAQLGFFLVRDSSAHDRSFILLIGCSVTLLGLSPKRTPRTQHRQSKSRAARTFVVISRARDSRVTSRCSGSRRT